MAVVEVPVEARLIEGRDGAEAHRHRWVLPELGHEPRVRIARQARATAADLPTEVVEVVRAQAALEERTRVHTGCCVPLEVDVVPGLAVLLAAEEVVEADLVEAGR